jgi:hypothetical protein
MVMHHFTCHLEGQIMFLRISPWQYNHIMMVKKLMVPHVQIKYIFQELRTPKVVEQFWQIVINHLMCHLEGQILFD